MLPTLASSRNFPLMSGTHENALAGNQGRNKRLRAASNDPHHGYDS